MLPKTKEKSDNRLVDRAMLENGLYSSGIYSSYFMFWGQEGKKNGATIGL